MSRLQEIQEQLTQLAAGDGNVLSIEQEGGEDIVQVVARGGGRLQVMVGTYPYHDEPAALIAAHGIPLPDSWELVEWEADTCATYDLPAHDVAPLAEFIDRAFTSLYGCGDTFTPVFTLERM